jgi:hypothetical protein
MRVPIQTLTGLLIAAAAIALGCGGAPIAEEPVIPESPDGTVRAVMDGLSRHQPEILWLAMPPSYQQDVNDLLSSFAENMDPALFDRAVAVARKGVVVLHSKKGLILSTETVSASGIDVERVDDAWESAVHFADALLASDLATLDAYPGFDVGGFLETSGAEMMSHAAAIATDGEGSDALAARLADLGETEVELVSRDGDEAVIRITPPDQESTELPMIRIEERWLPAELAERWPEGVADAEARIAMLGSDEAAQLKVQALIAIGVVEGFIDQIDEMDVPEELDSLIGGILANVLDQQRQTVGVAAEG